MKQVDAQVLAELKAKTSITEVVNKFVPLTKGKAKCPFHTDKTPSFQVKEKDGIYKCFGCGKGGDAISFIQELKSVSFIEAVKIVSNIAGVHLPIEVEYKRPTPIQNAKNDTPWRKVVEWFNGRGISELTLRDLKVEVTEEFIPQVNAKRNAIAFQYFRGEQLINVKYRDSQKNFKLVSGAELILYNLNAITQAEEVWIVEGEMDALSLHEVGIKTVLSVPNGATKDTNNLAYIDNCIDDLKGKRFHLLLDNDANGRKLRNELARRFGVNNCDYVVLDECKDANEYLQKHGKAELLEAAKVFIPFPVEGSFTIANIQDEILDMYQNGLEPPTKVGLGDFDNLIGLTPGYILTVTGIPGHGKSEFVDELTARLILKHGWRCGAHSPENKPTRLHVSKLIRKVVGRGWMGQDKMSATDVHRAMNMLNEKMWWIKSQKEFSVDKLLSAVDELIQSYGIKFFIIDAWNTLYHEDGSDQYISRQLQKISTFCETKGVLAVIVAHPFKMQKEKDSDEYRTVTPYDIKGASEWYDKSDIILTVQRNFTTNNTRVHVWKVKFSHWGKVGSCDFAYDPPSGRYINPLVPNSSQLHSWLDPDVQLELPVVEVTNEQPKPIAANNFFIEPVDRVETIHEQYETPKYNETTDTFDNAPF